MEEDQNPFAKYAVSEDNTSGKEAEENPFSKYSTSTASSAVQTAAGEPMLKMPPPSTDMYDVFKVGKRTDTEEDRKTKEAETNTEIMPTAWEIYNGLTQEDEDGKIVNPNVRKSPNLGYLYKDPSDGQVYRMPEPSSILTSKTPIVGKYADQAYNYLFPEAYADDTARVNLFTKIEGGMADAWNNAVQLSGAIVDVVGEKTGLYDTDLSKQGAGNKDIPKSNTGMSTADALIEDGVGIASGFILGGIAGEAVEQGVRTAGKTVLNLSLNPLSKAVYWERFAAPVLKQIAPATNKLVNFDTRLLAKAIGGEAGVATTADNKMSTILIGDNSIAPFGDWGIKTDEGASEAQSVVNARANILMDSLLASGILGTGVKAAVAAGNFINQALFGKIVQAVAGSDYERQLSQMDSVLNDLSLIESKASQQTVDDARDRIIAALRNNKTFVLEASETGGTYAEIALDVLSAIERGEGISEATKIQARSMFKANVTSSAASGGQLAAQASSVSKSIDGVLSEEARAVLTQGGNAGDAARGIGELQTARVDKAGLAVEDARAAVDTKTRSEIMNLLADPNFGGDVQRVAGVQPSAVRGESGAKAEQMADGIIVSTQKALAAKNAAFDAIPDDVKFDYDTFAAKVRIIGREEKLFEDAARKSLTTRLMELINEGTSPKAGNTPYIEAQPFANLENSPSGTFKYLFNTIRPKIVDLIDDAYTQGNSDLARKFIEIKKFIDDEGVKIAESSTTTAGRDAAAAMEEFKQYASLYRDAPFERVTNLIEKNSLQTNTLKNTAQDVATETLESGYANNIQALQQVLSRSGRDMDQTVVDEYLTAKIFETIWSDVNSKGIGQIDVGKLIAGIENYSTTLSTRNSPLGMQLDTFVANIRRAGNNTAALQAELDMAEETLKAVKSDALSKALAPFINKYMDPELGVISNAATGELRSLFAKKGVADLIPQILKESDNNPIIKEGLQSEYIKYLRSIALGTTEDIGGAAVMQPGAIKKWMDKEGSETMTVMDSLFDDKPKMQILLREVMGFTNQVGGSRASKAMPSGSNTNELQQFQGAVNRLIYITAGPLSRTGTRIRAGMQFASDKLDVANQAPKAMDTLLADPDLALQLAEEIARRRSSVGFGEDFRISREMADKLFQAGLRVGLYAEEDRQPVYSFWDTVMSAEQSITDTASQMKQLIPN